MENPTDKDPDCKDVIRPGMCAPRYLLPEVRRRIRTKYPLPDARFLRRSQEPIYTAMHHELEEDGFVATAKFLTHLISLEKELQRHLTEGQHLKCLHEAPKLLEELIECFKLTERMELKTLKTVVHNLMDIGNRFADGIYDFQWVAEDVLLKALQESRRILTDQGQTTATVLYWVGCLYSKHGHFEAANEFFQEAVSITEFKEWTVSRAINLVLYNEICKAFTIAMNSLAMQVYETDPNKAKQLSENSIALAHSCKEVDAIANAHLSYAKILMLMNRFEAARTMFEKCCELRRAARNMKNQCRSELDLCECLFRMEKYSDCLRHAKRSLKIAKQEHFLRELAETYAMMAKSERLIGINGLGAQNFMNAVEIFNELNDWPNTRLARCWAAITIGQSIIPPYTDTVLKSEKERLGDNVYTASLLDWKLSRRPFWQSTDQGNKYVSQTDTNFGESEDAVGVPNHDGKRSACDMILLRISKENCKK